MPATLDLESQEIHSAPAGRTQPNMSQTQAAAGSQARLRVCSLHTPSSFPFSFPFPLFSVNPFFWICFPSSPDFCFEVGDRCQEPLRWWRLDLINWFFDQYFDYRLLTYHYHKAHLSFSSNGMGRYQWLDEIRYSVN